MDEVYREIYAPHHIPVGLPVRFVKEHEPVRAALVISEPKWKEIEIMVGPPHTHHTARRVVANLHVFGPEGGGEIYCDVPFTDHEGGNWGTPAFFDLVVKPL